jgi:hypothetical protein
MTYTIPTPGRLSAFRSIPPLQGEAHPATLDALPQRVAKLFLPVAHLRCMPSPEEYRKRAKEAREQAEACRNEWERQGLLIIAEQCERLAAYKDLTGRRSVPAPAPAPG